MKINSAWAWAVFAVLGAFPVAIVMTWYDLQAVGSLWKKCDLADASGGVVITFVVLPVALLLHVTLLPICMALFAGCQRVAVTLMVKKRWREGAALGLVIPVGVVIGLAAAVLASVVVMGVAKAQIPPDYPTTCSELGNGNA
ncbi:hypothetical protein AB0I53_47715 [Saccharopolyspora sp. NPDC050389]|uniref:hypothetical protein n=1 Tax=Saccharopolyspora sp. NPDC050389 TaxID=3155516 RepID=UPI0033C16220